MNISIDLIKEQTRAAVYELIGIAKLRPGAILIVGCSTSEITGKTIGTGSDISVGKAVYAAMAPLLSENGIYLAAQCCEHLNRAVVTERAAVPLAEPVNAVPREKAGGSFAASVYGSMRAPVVIEKIRADAGIDIGETLIGMHLKEVAVPVRLKNGQIGMARVTAARTRPKYIGGERAVYNDDLR